MVLHKFFLYIPNVYIIIFIFHMNHIQFFKLTMPFNPHKQVTSVAIHITVVVKLYRCGLCPRFIASAEIVSVVSVKVEVQDCHTVTHNHQTCRSSGDLPNFYLIIRDTVHDKIIIPSIGHAFCDHISPFA